MWLQLHQGFSFYLAFFFVTVVFSQFLSRIGFTLILLPMFLYSAIKLFIKEPFILAGPTFVLGFVAWWLIYSTLGWLGKVFEVKTSKGKL